MDDVEVVYNCCSINDVWAERVVDLSAWAGQTVDIRWTFQTTDAWFNFFYGWAVDNVTVGVPGTHPDCDDNGVPDECDLDFNQNGTPDACEPPLGANYCEATPNSSGLPASLYALGSPFITDDDVTLVTVNAPANTVGYYLMSENQAFIPGFGGGQGNLCLGPPIVRFSHQPGGVLTSGDAGIMGYELDLSDLPHGIGFSTFDMWNFQLWFRDHNPGSTSNTSDGVRITFL